MTKMMTNEWQYEGTTTSSWIAKWLYRYHPWHELSCVRVCLRLCDYCQCQNTLAREMIHPKESTKDQVEEFSMTLHRSIAKPHKIALIVMTVRSILELRLIFGKRLLILRVQTLCKWARSQLCLDCTYKEIRVFTDKHGLPGHGKYSYCSTDTIPHHLYSLFVFVWVDR